MGGESKVGDMVKIRINGGKPAVRRTIRAISRGYPINIFEDSISNYLKTDKEGFYNLYFNAECKRKGKKGK